MIYKHQHEPLPHERLEDVPQPVVLLLDKLLQKDPAQRFQTPKKAQSEWHLGEIPSCQNTMAEAIAPAKELNDMHGIAEALFFGACLGQYERNVAEVERLASELMEVSTRQNFAFWLAGGVLLRGWARSAFGDTGEGISWIETGIEDWRATSSVIVLSYFFSVKGGSSASRGSDFRSSRGNSPGGGAGRKT